MVSRDATTICKLTYSTSFDVKNTSSILLKSLVRYRKPGPGGAPGHLYGCFDTGYLLCLTGWRQSENTPAKNADKGAWRLRLLARVRAD
jgi:hypothetical protein